MNSTLDLRASFRFAVSEVDFGHFDLVQDGAGFAFLLADLCLCLQSFDLEW